MKFNLPASLIRQYAVVITVNLGVVTTGMSLAWTSPMLVKLRNETETPLSRPITEDEGSWIVSGGFLAAIFSIFLGGVLLDAIGRKYSFLLICLPKFLMAVLFIFATEVWMLIVGRVIMGVGDSFLFMVAPIYASEIASKEHRGSLGTFMQIFSCLGIVVTLSLGPFLSYTAFNIVLASAIAASTVPVFCMPESPFHLYSKGRTEEALAVLLQIRASEAIAKQELQEYQDSNKKADKIDKKQLLQNRTFLKSLALGFLLFVGSQITGYNAIQFYLQTILVSTKTSVKPEIASVVIGVIQVFASFCTPLFLTKFGRRPVLICSLSGMFLGMLGLGTFFKLAETGGEITGILNFLPIISLILVVYCFSAGIGSLSWLVTAEVFDGPSRAFGVSIALMSSLISMFVMTKYFAFMLVGTLIAVFLPETKGKTFSEIQRALGGESIEISEKNDKERV
ncbi:facilitated trehalose transporter Tret1-like isoform X2 [Maniola jurtina]|uniref:facilitated trehalose transporter Tret1-like isoform X2 n=1 Tax=Maniola jurtina TaxID=191418 RepID=UPI001E68BE12|nr:facilitated trehalose transporter Tret1-like isoform X2 [Maniola jurtina]